MRGVKIRYREAHEGCGNHLAGAIDDHNRWIEFYFQRARGGEAGAAFAVKPGHVAFNRQFPEQQAAGVGRVHRKMAQVFAPGAFTKRAAGLRHEQEQRFVLLRCGAGVRRQIVCKFNSLRMRRHHRPQCAKKDEERERTC